MSVPQETREHRGTPVAVVFRENAAVARRYANTLLTKGVHLGLLGPAEPARLWERHILNCAVIAPVFDERSAVCDVGSGAGLPGLVLALARPDLTVTLLEPQSRRYSFLIDIVDELGLAVEVIRGRAQDLAKVRTFDYVTARAVARLDRLVEWTWPLWSRTGELVAIKGESIATELSELSRNVNQRPISSPRIERYGYGVVTPPTTVVRIKSRPEFPT